MTKTSPRAFSHRSIGISWAEFDDIPAQKGSRAVSTTADRGYRLDSMPCFASECSADLQESVLLKRPSDLFERVLLSNGVLVHYFWNIPEVHRRNYCWILTPFFQKKEVHIRTNWLVTWDNPPISDYNLVDLSYAKVYFSSDTTTKHSSVEANPCSPRLMLMLCPSFLLLASPLQQFSDPENQDVSPRVWRDGET
jgi:hypothetical protein